MQKENTSRDVEVIKPVDKLKGRKPNVAAYARVSTKNDEQYGSLFMQKTYYRNYIKANPEWNYVGIYSDDSSGLTIDKRPGFMAMLDDCQKGRVDIILCKSASRFSRNVVDGMTALRELRRLGIEVIFEDSYVPLSDQNAELVYSVLFALYQEESHNRSDNTRWGLRQAMKSGDSKLYNRPCYGYRRDKEGKLVIYEPEAKVVRKIFAWHKQKLRYSAIVRLLKAEGIKSPRSKDTWSVQVVIDLLKNEKYRGDVVLGKTYVKDYLNKRSVKNTGERPIYKRINNHEGIIKE